MKTVLSALLFVAHAAAAPNVVVILVDDLGFGDLGIYGSTKNRTPNIDALARGGTRMTAAYATPLCSPTRAALMTGKYAPKTGVNRVLFPSDNIGLRASENTIGEHFQSMGYDTALIGKWHLGHHIEHLPNQHGFNYFFGLPYSNDMRQTAGYPPLTLIRQNTVIREVTDDQQHLLQGWYTDEATGFIQRARAQGHAFFLVLSETKVHSPYHPSPAFLAKAGGDVYRAEVEEMDDAVGQVLAAAGPDTLVVFMSDNGGTPKGSNAPLRGFKASFLEGGVRVPMIWHWPGHIPAGVVNSKVVSVMDLLPTLVKAVGGTVQQPGLDGKDIMPNLLMNSRPSPYNAYRYYAIGSWFKVKAIRSGDFKLNLVTGALYNLRTDQKELRNVAGSNPDVVKRLKALAR